MLARKVLDLAEQQGLLEPKVIEDLRQKVAETKFVVNPATIAKILVDTGHLTPFQARKLVSQALESEPDPEFSPPPRVSRQTGGPPRQAPQRALEELTLQEDTDLAPSQDDDEIVELEAVEPPPPAPPPAAKPSSKAQVSRPSEKPEKPAKKERPAPAPAVADEDLIGLDPIAPVGESKGKWKTDPEVRPARPAEQVDVLEELDGLTPLDSPAADPLASASDKAAPAAPLGKAKVRRNVWDSPLLLVGGGLLGVILIAFLALLYALTRGTAAEVFNKADAEYKGGNYAAAIDAYKRFLDRYPSDPNASLAQVKSGLAQLHQVADDRKNPGLALETAKQVLPAIEKEEKFGEARGELASILPDIADGFATQAGQTADLARREELVKLAGEAMLLVNNPSYIPATLRKEREGRLTGILDKLKAAQRSIDQDRELLAAVGKIKAAAEKGNARDAYQIRDDLVRAYPAVESNPQLVEAILGVGESERKLVKVTEGGTPASTDDAPATDSRVIVAWREGSPRAGSGPPVFVLVEGAVYALDSANGRVLWRRFVGYETAIPPVALGTPAAGAAADVLVAGTGDLLRLNGTTGQLLWKQTLSDGPTAPLVFGDHVLVTTRKGRLVMLEAKSGNVVRCAQLPQAAGVAASASAQQSRLFQLGEHSTLFVLNPETLACTETIYLGHKAGAIFVPPAAVLDLLVVVESPTDDYSLLRVLAPDPKTRRLTEVGKPFRLKGRVLTPLAVKGRRAAVITDLGHVAVYEADASNPAQPVRLLASQEPGERVPLLQQLTFDGNRLWTAGRRCLMYEVQGSTQQLNRKWAVSQDDVFIGPLSLQGETLVHARRRPGGAAVLVEGASAADGKPLWTTHLAAPIVGLAVSQSRMAVDVLTGEGRLFSLGVDQLRAGYVDAPSFAPPPGSPLAIWPEAALAPDQSQLLWTEPQPGGRIYGYDVAAAGTPRSAVLPAGAQAAAGAQLLGQRWLVPLTNGSVMLLEPGSSSPAIQPFLPPLDPNSLPQWTRPAASAAGDKFLISDGRGVVYSVALRNQPQPHLAQAGSASTSGPLVSPLVQAGEAYFGVLRREANDALAAFDAQGQSVLDPVALSGRWQAGPFAAGGLVLLSAEPEGLLCFESGGKLRWQQPLAHGPLAGAPLLYPDGDLLIIHQSGMVRRVDPASGAELAAANVGEPLGGATRILGPNLYLAGSDGVLHRIALPARP